MADPSTVVRDAFKDPDRLLGAVERNVEAKVIAPVLELLGWDPARQVLWGPQVQRQTEAGREDVEADAFVADIAEGRLRFVVEAKRWARPLDVNATSKTLGYLDDVGARRALLTNGVRWLIIDAGQSEPVMSHSVRMDGDLSDAIALLVGALAPYLSPMAAPTSELPPSRRATPAGADVDQIAAEDPLVGELVSGIRAIASEHANVIYVDAGPKGLLVRLHGTGRVILPVNASDPLKPDLYAQELESLAIVVDIRDMFVAMLRRLPRERTSEAVTAFLASFAAVISSIG